MFGFLSFCIIVASILANKTKIIWANKSNKEKARKRGNCYYTTYKGAKKLLVNGHPCVETNGIIIDSKTNLIIKDNFQDILNKYDNKLLYEKGAPGYKKSIVTKWLGYVASEKDIFWVENNTNKPYVLLRYKSNNKQKIIYYKCYFISNKVGVRFFNGKNCLDVYETEKGEVYGLFDKNLDLQSKKILTKKEFDAWNLDNYR